MTLLLYKPIRASSVCLVVFFFQSLVTCARSIPRKLGEKKRFCSVCRINKEKKKIHEESYFALQEIKAESFGGSAKHGKQCWESTCSPRKEGRRVPQRRGWCSNRRFLPRSRCHLNISDFLPPWSPGPCWDHCQALKEFHPEQWEGNTKGGWRRVWLTAGVNRQISDPCISDGEIRARQGSKTCDLNHILAARRGWRAYPVLRVSRERWWWRLPKRGVKRNKTFLCRCLYFNKNSELGCVKPVLEKTRALEETPQALSMEEREMDSLISQGMYWGK